MADKEMALAILQACIALAGLILIYSGFLAARGLERQGDRSGDRFMETSRYALVPVLSAFLCTWMAVRVLLVGHWGHDWCASWLVLAFEIVLAVSALYAIIAATLSTV